jgi:hypothetical protein
MWICLKGESGNDDQSITGNTNDWLYAGLDVKLDVFGWNALDGASAFGMVECRAGCPAWVE